MVHKQKRNNINKCKKKQKKKEKRDNRKKKRKKNVLENYTNMCGILKKFSYEMVKTMCFFQSYIQYTLHPYFEKFSYVYVFVYNKNKNEDGKKIESLQLNLREKTSKFLMKQNELKKEKKQLMRELETKKEDINTVIIHHNMLKTQNSHFLNSKQQLRWLLRKYVRK